MARAVLRDESAATTCANPKRSPRRRADLSGRRRRFRQIAVRVAEQLEHLLLLGIFSDPLGPALGRKRKEDDQRDHEQKHDDEEEEGHKYSLVYCL